MVRPILCGGCRPLFEDFLFQGIGSQFFLDGFHLLVQEELSLLLVQIGFDLSLNVLLQREHLLFLVQKFQDFLGSSIEANFFENALLVFNLDLHVASNEIDQKSQAVDAFDGFCSFRRNVGIHFNQLSG